MFDMWYNKGKYLTNQWVWWQNYHTK